MKLEVGWLQRQVTDTPWISGKENHEKIQPNPAENINQNVFTISICRENEFPDYQPGSSKTTQDIGTIATYDSIENKVKRDESIVH